MVRKLASEQAEFGENCMRNLSLQHAIDNKCDELNSVEDAIANAKHNLKAINLESKQQLTLRVSTKLPEPLEPILKGAIAL